MTIFWGIVLGMLAFGIFLLVVLRISLWAWSHVRLLCPIYGATTWDRRYFRAGICKVCGWQAPRLPDA